MNEANRKNEKSKTKEEWMSYIQKISDREIQRRRESGFTTWALLGALAASLLLLFEIDSIGNLHLFYFLVAVGDIFTVLISIYTILYMIGICLNQEISDWRFNSLLSNKKEIVFIALLFLIFIGLGSLFLIIYQRQSWPIYVFLFSLYIAQAIGIVAYYYITRIRNKSGFRLPLNYFSKKRMPLLIVVGVLFVLTIAIISLVGIPINKENIITIKAAGLTVIILVAAIILIMKYVAYDAKLKWLEDLENKIMTKNLSAEEIHLEYVTILFGEELSTKISQLEEQDVKLYDEVKKEYRANIQRWDELNYQIDNYQGIKSIEENRIANRMIKDMLQQIRIRIKKWDKSANVVRTMFGRYTIFTEEVDSLNSLLPQGISGTEKEILVLFIDNHKARYQEIDMCLKETNNQANKLKELHDKMFLNAE